MSPIVTRMNRCSIDARVRRAYRVMSWEAIPYVTCLKRPMNRLRPRGSSSSGAAFGSRSSDIVTSSNAVQVELVLFGRVSLPEDPPLPGLDPRGEIREEPEGVVRRKDRQADHVAHRHHHEQGLERGPGLQGVASVLVAAHPVQEVPQGPAQAVPRHVWVRRSLTPAYTHLRSARFRSAPP